MFGGAVKKEDDFDSQQLILREDNRVKIQEGPIYDEKIEAAMESLNDKGLATKYMLFLRDFNKDED